jgi:hypothetical protein
MLPVVRGTTKNNAWRGGGRLGCGTDWVERTLCSEFGWGLIGQQGVGVGGERLRAAIGRDDGVWCKC